VPGDYLYRTFSSTQFDTDLGSVQSHVQGRAEPHRASDHRMTIDRWSAAEAIRLHSFFEQPTMKMRTRSAR
jgi:hypothetical protein